MASLLWTDAHAPRSLDACAGNDDARAVLRQWALDWERGKLQKPLLLHGPPGSGKSAAVHALALERGWPLLETNASDLRNAENVKKLAGLASSTTSLFGGRRLVFFDEVDGAFDRGEVPALLAVLKQSGQPVAFAANDAWNKKLAPLRALCRLVAFKRVNVVAIEKTLSGIAEKEGVPVGGEELKNLARASEGDVRAAILDLQASAGVLAPAEAGRRDRQRDVFRVLASVFKAERYADALRAGDDADVDLDTLLAWVEENVPNEFESREEVARAFHWLSRANVFKGRIRRRQDYSFLKYVRALGLAGVALSKAGPSHRFVSYKYPSLLRKMGGSREERALLASASAKAARKTHSSSREAKTALLPFVGVPSGAAAYFNFSDEEAELLSALYDFKGQKRGQQRQKKQGN